MLAVQHARVEVGEDAVEIVVVQDVDAQVGRLRNRLVVRQQGRADRGGRRFHGAGDRPRRCSQGGRVPFQFPAQSGAPVVVHEPVGEVQPAHRVVGVAHQAVVLGRDLTRGETRGQRGAADQQRTCHTRGLEVLGGDDHLLRGFHQQSRQPHHVGPVRACRLDQGFGRDLDAQIDHAVAVVGQNDLDQILADVVHVALDRGQDDGALVHSVHFLHERFQVLDRGLHGLGALQDLGDDEFVVVEQPADLVHAGHEWAVDDVQRGPLRQRGIQVVGQAVLGALDDGAGQAFVQRQVGARVRDDRLFLPAEVGGEGGHRVVAAPVDQILGQPFLVLGNGGVARQLFGVDDRQVEPGLDTQVEEDRVEDFAAGRRQAERDVADAENGLAGREGTLDRLHPRNRLPAGTDVVPVAGAEREHQRIEDQVFGRQPIFFGQ